VNPLDALPVVLLAGFCVSFIERFLPGESSIAWPAWFGAVVNCGDPM